MGQRGPGAKPIKKSSTKARRSRSSWNKKGLSRADRVITFVESLRITSGTFSGTNFRLRDWQKEIIFGIYGEKDGRRIVRQALITLPRKNGKTQLVAALALAHLAGPEAESRGQVFSAAADRAQAGLIFQELEAFIQADEALSERLNIRRFDKKIEDFETGSIYQALSSDARKAHGLNSSFVVCDELAQWRSRELYDNLLTSTGGRAEPLVITISTQNSDPHHIMSELTEYGRQVRDGVIEDETFHPTIYESMVESDPWDEAEWFKCNPALDDFRSLEEMRSFAEQAKRIPAREAVFRNLYLNQPIDSEQRFIAAADWDACYGLVEPEDLRGRPCWGGLDLSSTRDLTSLVLFFPDDDGAVIPYFWVPGDSIGQREDEDKVPYRTWRNEGLIEAPAGRAIDKLSVVRRLAEIASQFNVQGIAYDRWRIEDTLKLLSDEGIDLPLIPWGQGFKDMGPAVDALETAILNRKLRQPGHPVLTWNLANAVVEIDPAGARKISKRKSTERVDGLVALAMATGLHAREPAPREYDFSRPLVINI